MSLESLTLRNFQTHEFFRVDFDPRITVIVGPTNSGKSSLLRALRWVCLNQFDGPANSFIHWDAESAKVTLIVDGQRLVRGKGSDNSYRLEDARYVAFGANKVPEPIEMFLGVSELNFQDQFDSHFWIGASAGAVSRELNQVINLEVMDSSMSHVSAKLRESQAERKVVQQRLSQAQSDVDELKWTFDANSNLECLETTSNRCQRVMIRLLQLEMTLSDARKTRKKVKRLSEASLEASAIALQAEVVKSVSITRVLLEKLIATLQRLDAESKRTELPEPPTPDKWLALQSRRESLVELLKSLQNWTDKISDIDEELKDLNAELSELKDHPCPLCGK